MNLAFLTTTAVTPIVADGLIPLTTIQRKYGCGVINPDNNSVYLNKPGYYKINASVTFTAPAAGVVSIALQKNEVDVPGITASTSITTADTEIRTLNINGIVRVMPCEGVSSLNLINSGVDADIQNVAFDIEYLN